MAHNHRIGGPKCMAPPSRGRVSVFRRSPSKSPDKRVDDTAGTIDIEMQEKRSTDMELETMETDKLRISRENESIESSNGSKDPTN